MLVADAPQYSEKLPDNLTQLWLLWGLLKLKYSEAYYIPIILALNENYIYNH